MHVRHRLAEPGRATLGDDAHDVAFRDDPHHMSLGVHHHDGPHPPLGQQSRRVAATVSPGAAVKTRSPLPLSTWDTSIGVPPTASDFRLAEGWAERPP